MKRMYLFTLRRAKHLTQAQAAEMLCMSPGNYNLIESGSRVNVYVGNVQDMAEAFKVSPYWLLRQELDWLDGKMSCDECSD